MTYLHSVSFMKRMLHTHIMALPLVAPCSPWLPILSRIGKEISGIQSPFEISGQKLTKSKRVGLTLLGNGVDALSSSTIASLTRP